MEEKSNNKRLVILVCFLSVLVLALGGFIFYDKILSKPELKNEESSNIIDNNDNSQKKEVKYDSEKDGDFYKLKSLTINEKDISKNFSSEYYNELNINKQDEFVIISYSSGGTCGFDTWDLLIFSYNGNLIYKNNEYKNDLDKLVYNGEYNYNASDKSLTIGYHLSCDMNCNICDKLFYEDENKEKEATCSTINKYRDINSEEKYKIKYLGNNMFTNEELIESTKIVNDDYYSYKFENCN